MRSYLPHLVALLLGGAAAVGLVACGSEDRTGLLSEKTAQSLADRLTSIQERVDAGECTALGDDLSRLRGAVVNLPQSVDTKLRTRLEEGVDNLVSIAPDECTGAPVETTTTETQTETKTETIETTTSPTTTATPTPTPEPEPTATPEPTPTPAPTPTPDTGGVSPDPGATP